MKLEARTRLLTASSFLDTLISNIEKMSPAQRETLCEGLDEIYDWFMGFAVGKGSDDIELLASTKDWTLAANAMTWLSKVFGLLHGLPSKFYRVHDFAYDDGYRKFAKEHGHDAQGFRVIDSISTNDKHWSSHFGKENNKSSSWERSSSTPDMFKQTTRAYVEHLGGKVVIQIQKPILSWASDLRAIKNFNSSNCRPLGPTDIYLSIDASEAHPIFSIQSGTLQTKELARKKIAADHFSDRKQTDTVLAFIKRALWVAQYYDHQKEVVLYHKNLRVSCAVLGAAR